MSKAVIFFAPGFEECEGLIVVDLLRRAGTQVQICAVSDELTIKSSHGVRIVCDALAKDADLTADAVILPGGIPGTPNLAASETVCSAVRAFYDAGKLVAAICAAPTVLGGLGLLQGKRATCYPGCEGDLGGAECADADAVRDGNLITGRALGAAIPFALEIIAYLEGAERAEKVKNAIVYRH